MCGISGYISNKSLLNVNGIDHTLKLMSRRGPDSSKYYKEDFGSKELALLHTRLSIIDLNKRASQPFEDKNFMVIFNGEIYNYIEIREDLKKKNYRFQTNSDTEVLLKSYQEYGSKCVDHFEGMWAFAIWDSKKKNLFLSRDPFGEKPLYYFSNRYGFFFGSEIKFIKSLYLNKFKTNNDLLNKNLFSGYKSLNKSTETFNKDIFLLESSSNMSVDLNLIPIKKKYWTPKININQKMKVEEATDGAKLHLIESLKLRMRSDVPLAFCLSGGIDSGILVSHAKKTFNKNVSSFSIIDIDERYNEEENIKHVVNDINCDSHLIKINDKKDIFLDRLNKLTKHHDGPIATLSYYVHSFLSESISKKGFKVSISGTGADEIFTGYYDHFLLHLESMNKTKYFNENLASWKEFVLPNIRNPYLKNPNLYIDNKDNRDIVFEKHFELHKYSVIKKEQNFKEIKYCDELLRNRMLNELFHEVVPVILKHDDLNSMYHSIENRSPFLDRKLLEFTLTIPPHLLISQGYQKQVLRNSAKDILVDDVRLSRQKKGFNTSINSVIDLKNPEIINFIFDKNSPINEYVDLKKLKVDITTKTIPNHLSKLLFSVISTKLFLENKTSI
jgi:asparagine synthase (glutamine-hydrolysing)